MELIEKKRAQLAWAMYDWANSAFATTVMASILPNYFAAYIATQGALAIWGYTVAIGSLITALISPYWVPSPIFAAQRRNSWRFSSLSA
jgi:MFS transporter, UMF1 family